ncbi:GNAT family N-acetyltransferase [Paenarthrobacter aurescens]|uniref:Acetyltransferase, GNAT family protein n=1 Tax=Paenarthrobacter aurescens (strain TC1) TaxID=290340 RepID=A1R759_PAEAT|nr:GNAT family N-acetyltransferase [Paenarthrobacter aurescens]ABM09698.1 acetyltransferase, GNAT family protein [Paenarthrobacter aurescens TC1]
MKPIVRLYDPERDAARVAELYNRNNYGTIRSGSPLTGDDVNAVLQERCAALFMVGEDRGNIVGTIGYLKVSGRRVAGDDELFSGMFLIDPGYRMGFLAGELFMQSFIKLVERGVRTLRLEVDPANQKAFPLYGRVGFRTAGIVSPDEDGYIELISFLPGVVSDLLRTSFADASPQDMFSKYSWRSMGSARGKDLMDGVSVQDGAPLLTYTFPVKKDIIDVQVDMSSGAIVHARHNGHLFDWPETPQRSAPNRPERPSLGSRRLGEFTISLDSGGTLTIDHPRHPGPVLTDHFPVGEDGAPYWRRPAALNVTCQELPDGWRTWLGPITREIRLLGDKVSVVVNHQSEQRVTAFPWVNLRSGEFHLTTEGRQRTLGGPIVRGLWPPDRTDFEAAESVFDDQSYGASALWTDTASGIALAATWHSEGKLRVEGAHLPAASSEAGSILYDVDLFDGAEALPVPDNVELPPSLTPVFHAVPSGPHQGWNPITWAAAETSRTDVLEAVGSNGSLLVSPDQGIVSWTAGQTKVLAAPFPKLRALGPLTAWNSGLWVTGQGAREDPEQGIEWGSGGRAPHLIGSPADCSGWEVQQRGNDLTALRIVVDGVKGAEQVTHVTPNAQIQAKNRAPILFQTDTNTDLWWAAARDRFPLRASVRRAAIGLGGTTWLVVENDQGTHPEILIRSTGEYLLLSLLARAGDTTTTSWLLSVQEMGSPTTNIKENPS